MTTESTASELRKTGVSVVGDVPWGTHFCYFYETKQDLLDLLIPYFKTGLEGNEFCLWIISNSELLTAQEARNALQKALPDFDRYVAERSLEVVGHDAWFLNGGSFDFHRVANRFKEKVDEALGRGYVGMRVNGSPAWLQTSNAEALRKFEEEVDQLYPNEPIIAACTYPIGRIKADFLLEVARNHQFAIARRQGRWDILETPELIQAKQQIEQLNRELEQRVRERTKELETANEKLGEEMKEHKRAEEQARKVLDTIPALIGSGTSNGILDYCNQQWLAYAGVSLEELQKDETLHPDDKARVVRAWQEAMATGKPYELEQRYRRFDGVYRWFLARGVPLKDAEGVIEGWYGTLTDIEDRKQAEEALVESRRKLKEAQRLANIGYWERDLITDRITWSEETGRILGLESFSGVPNQAQLYEFIHPDDRQHHEQVFNEALQDSRLFDVEVRFVRPDGGVRFVHIRDEIVRDEAGKPIRMFGAVQDITERKRAAKELNEANDQLRFLSRRLFNVQEEERRHLARELHDEVGQALTATKLNLKIITPDVPASAVGRLKDSIQLLDRLLGQVRQLSLDLRPPLLDQLGLVPTVRWLVDEQGQRTGLHMSFTASVDDLKIDPAVQIACFRVVQEAITNVIRHSHAKSVKVDLRREADRLWLNVRDDGVGFDPAAIQRGAERHSSLGLVSMKERTLLVRGGLEVRSARGGGTEIRAWFPLMSQGVGSATEAA
jgi:PAS domain S-box-containing protein